MSKCGCKVNNVKIEQTQLKDLQKDIDLLVTNRNMQLDEVAYTNPKVQKALDNVKLAVNMLYDTKQYDTILYMIDKSKKKLPNLDIKPQTVGAYLFGCTFDNYGDVKDKGSSALCNGSITNKEMLKCNNFIFYHNGNTLKQLSYPNNKNKQLNVLLYVEKDFQGLTPFQLDTVKQATDGYKINSVMVYETVNNKHKLVNTYTDLNSLPTVSVGPTGVIMPVLPSLFASSTGASSRGLYISTSSLFWLAILIIVIILLIVGYGWWKNYGKKR